MRWGTFCSVLTLATMVATVGVPDANVPSADAERAWDGLAGPLLVSVTRPLRLTVTRVRVAGSGLAVALTSPMAVFAGLEESREAGFAGHPLPLHGQGLCRKQTSRGPPVV